MKIKFPRREEFVCTSEFEISKHLSQKVCWRLLFFLLGENIVEILSKAHLISAATEARPEQIAPDAGGGRGRGTSPRFSRRSPRPRRPPRPSWPPARSSRPSLGFSGPGGVRSLAAGGDASHLLLRGGPGAHDGGGQDARASPPWGNGRALCREGEGACQAPGAAGRGREECEY